MRRGLVLVLSLAAGCDQCGGLPSGWALLRDNEPGALLSVRVQDGVVWVGGGDPDGVDGPATGTLLVDDDPSDDVDFQAIDTGLQGDFWWVHPVSGTVAFVGGSFGRVVRVDRSTSPVQIDVLTTPATDANDPDIVVFGVYATIAADGSDEHDVWAVGGRTGGSVGGFAWHKRGDAAFVDVAVPSAVEGYALWKVDGRRRGPDADGVDDVWMVGTNGQTFHVEGVDGADHQLVAVPTGLNTSLFTVDVNDDGAVAVGGLGRGLVVSRGTDAGTPWQDITPGDTTPSLLGVHRGLDEGLVVGSAGAAFRLRDGVMTPEVFGFPMFQSLHSAFVDDDSGLAWAVGGQLTSIPLRSGVLLRRAP
jgi:hypothetical protein